MWLAGGVDRAKWFAHRFVTGQLVEGAARDDSGKAQGTVLVEVLGGISTSTTGHWFEGRYVVASDPHLRWWMDQGDGRSLAAKCRYHCCEVPSVDCPELKRGRSFHFEKFRVINQKELDAKVPAWAFGRSCAKLMKAYLANRTEELPPPGGDGQGPRDELPWREAGDEESSGSSDASGSDRGDLKAKLQAARDKVKALEKRYARGDKKEKKAKDGKEKKKHKKRRGSRREERSRSSRRRRKKKGEQSPRRSRRVEGPEKDKKPKERGADKEKKRRSSPTSPEGSEDERQPRLFGGDGSDESDPGHSARGRPDRGPFGGGDVVRYGEGSDSDSESFRDAPAGQKAGNQVHLIQYAKKKPGRLASRLLLKMRREGAQGSVGASRRRDGLTPPSAVHYLVTVMGPRLGTKLNMRSQRELRTLCTVLDMMAQHRHAQAADLVGQRIKALEKATADGHWASAQHLELLSPEMGGLLERDEEIYTSREHLLDLKLQSYEGWKKGPKSDQKGDQEKGGRKGKEKGRGKGKESSVTAPGDPMSLWMERWQRWRSEEHSPAEVLEGLWLHLRSLPSKLGHFSLASAGDGVPPGAGASTRVRGDDLLPIDLREVATHLLDAGSTVANSVACVLNSLNYLALCSGHAPVPTVMPERTLTSPQKEVIEHVRRAVEHLEATGERVAPFERMSAELKEARFDYSGEPILMMEDLEAEQVIAAWPAIGQAAVQDATTFLPDHIREKLEDPRACLLPLHEWPSPTPISKVRASDEEWHKVVAAAHVRGLMAPLDPEDVFKDASGEPVLNGAGAVPKFKTIGGQKQKCQRFISNLIPSNAFQTRIDGDDKYLPYLGQLTLLEQEADQV